jgi:ribonucleotide monophosphatase NagD (HAD superfamily)
MVGDRPETDIAFAKAAGWRSVLTLTGVTSGTTHIPAEFTPDHVVGSLTDLEAVLGQAVGTGPDEG